MEVDATHMKFTKILKSKFRNLKERRYYESGKDGRGLAECKEDV